jgi:Ca2+-binding RTX toxin-like protein
MAIFGTTGNDVKDGTDLADSMFGLAGDDELHGKGGNDLLSGDDGSDKLFGGAGNDLMFSGLEKDGDDIFDGGAGIDTISFAQRQLPIAMNLGLGSVIFEAGTVDILQLNTIENVIGTKFDDRLGGNSGANSLSGSGGDDVLDGLGGNDNLSGGSGADALNGGAGQDILAGNGGIIDVLTGGTGADTFRFFTTSDTGVGGGKRDVIADFTPGVDKLDLNFVDAKVAASGDQAFAFVGSKAFTAEGQVRVVTEGDHNVIQLNTSGVSGAEAEIHLTGQVNVAASDFFL